MDSAERGKKENHQRGLSKEVQRKTLPPKTGHAIALLIRNSMYLSLFVGNKSPSTLDLFSTAPLDLFVSKMLEVNE
jgi:hypothetical protein